MPSASRGRLRKRSNIGVVQRYSSLRRTWCRPRSSKLARLDLESFTKPSVATKSLLMPSFAKSFFGCLLYLADVHYRISRRISLPAPILLIGAGRPMQLNGRGSTVGRTRGRFRNEDFWFWPRPHKGLTVRRPSGRRSRQPCGERRPGPNRPFLMRPLVAAPAEDVKQHEEKVDEIQVEGQGPDNGALPHDCGIQIGRLGKGHGFQFLGIISG